MEGDKKDKFKLWWLEQCQVCDSITVSFLTHGFRHLWIWSCLSLCCLRTRREGRSFFGVGAAADGRKFPLRKWSQGRIEPPNSEGKAGFAFFAQQTELSASATICIAHFLVVPSSSWLEKLRCSGRVFVAYSKLLLLLSYATLQQTGVVEQMLQ